MCLMQEECVRHIFLQLAVLKEVEGNYRGGARGPHLFHNPLIGAAQSNHGHENCMLEKGENRDEVSEVPEVPPLEHFLLLC